MSEKPHILIVKTSAIGDVIHVFAVLDYLRDKFPQAQIDWVVEKPIAQLLSPHPQLSHVIPIDSRKWRANLFSRTTAEQWRLFFRRLRQTQYDVLFDLQGNCKSALITACARAVVKVGFGYKSVREKLNLLATNMRVDVPQEMAVRDMYLQLVKNYYRDFSNRSFQAISLLLTVEERERLRVILSLPIFHKAPLLMVAFGSKWPNKQLGYPFLHKFISRVAERLGLYFS